MRPAETIVGSALAARVVRSNWEGVRFHRKALGGPVKNEMLNANVAPRC